MKIELDCTESELLESIANIVYGTMSIDRRVSLKDFVYSNDIELLIALSVAEDVLFSLIGKRLDLSELEDE